VKYGDLTRKLRRVGCYPTRHGAGSHEIWRNPATAQQAPVPYHRTKDIGPNVLARILHGLGINRDEFDKA
jgi:predicted RNA binding protein YcfA (HicA-like mRNA interferase family)